MKLVLRTSLLALVAVLIAFAPAHSQGFKFFGKGRSKAHTRYSIVAEYKEAYTPGGGWFGKKKSASKPLKRRSAARF